MIEPTETEGKDTLDRFAEVLARIAEEAADDPELLHGAPYSTPVRRLDEAAAVKQPDLAWRPRRMSRPRLIAPWRLFIDGTG